MPDLGGFHFLRPWWLAALPVALLAAWQLGKHIAASGAWLNVVSAALRSYVLIGTPRARSSRRWTAVITAVALSTGIVALAGPAWRQLPQPMYRAEDALVIALDLSRSMDAKDLVPSRLGRARLKVIDILGRRDGSTTALVVFSAHAFVVTPLTDDTDTIAAMVGSLSTDIMPSRGSFPPSAIRKARDLLTQAGAERGGILLVTDGGAYPETLDAADEIAADGIRLSVLGVGTPEGSPIPRNGGGFLTDQSGNIVMSRLDESSLRRLAQRGRGQYRRMTADSADLDAIFMGVNADATGATAAEGDGLKTDGWREEGPWLLLALLPLAAFAFRRGVLVAFAGVALIAPLDRSFAADESEYASIWRTPDQQGARALENGDPGTAADLFVDNRWRSAAAYRAGDFVGSAEALQGLGEPDDLYNLGNAYAKSGQLEAAIAAYESALSLEEAHEDAQFNLDLIRDLLDNQQQQQGQQGQQGQSGDSSGEEQQDGEQTPQNEQSESDQRGQSRSGSAGDDDTASSQSSPSQQSADAAEDDSTQAEQSAEAGDESDSAEPAQGSPEPGDSSDDPQEAMQAAAESDESLEERQAAEQWLRRIPDDPGGLLRNKFRRQYQRRGVDQDGNSLWPGDEAEPW